jgi:hypothetical protein
MDSKKVVTYKFNIIFLYMRDLVVETMPENCIDKKFIGSISNHHLLIWIIITYYTHDPKCDKVNTKGLFKHCIWLATGNKQDQEIKTNIGSTLWADMKGR